MTSWPRPSHQSFVLSHDFKPHQGDVASAQTVIFGAFFRCCMKMRWSLAEECIAHSSSSGLNSESTYQNIATQYIESVNTYYIYYIGYSNSIYIRREVIGLHVFAAYNYLPENLKFAGPSL